jgi:DnaJ-class molecular chaperone
VPSAEADRERLRAGHLETLGLRGRATAVQIHAAYKALAFEHHPDRARKSQKDAARVRLSAINEAYSWLVSHNEENAA